MHQIMGETRIELRKACNMSTTPSCIFWETFSALVCVQKNARQKDFSHKKLRVFYNLLAKK